MRMKPRHSEDPLSRRLVVPPAPAEVRALRRAALVGVAANVLALGVTAYLGDVMPGPDLAARREAMHALGEVPFRVLWLLWAPASLSYLIFLAAWNRAVRPGGLAASAVPLGTAAATLDVLSEVLYAWALPSALLTGTAEQVAIADQAMWVLITVPANALYATAFALLAGRSWRSGRLPRGLLLGLLPFLGLALLTLGAGVAGRYDLAGVLVGPWFLAIVAWWVALARWTRQVGVRA
jgi:hypothetical protein